MRSLLSTATVTAIGLTCKAFMNLDLCNVTVNGLPILLNALHSERRNHRQGVVTVCNHISTLDDPVTWGILPTRFYLSSRMTRWALGASDIMFTNPVLSAFFRNGQVLETFRGKGIYQPAVDFAIEKLNQGGWVHLYGEGKINQPQSSYILKDGVASLPRFKWGVGRILMETPIPPVIIPMWITGFDRLMPEERPFPNNYLPRLNVHLTVTVGEPIPADHIQSALRIVGKRADILRQFDITSREGVPTASVESAHASGWVGEGVSRQVSNVKDREAMLDLEMKKVRSEVTAIVQGAVQALGRAVSGDMLGVTR